MLYFLLGIITGVLITIGASVLAFLIRKPLEKALQAIQSSVEDKAVIIDNTKSALDYEYPPDR